MAWRDPLRTHADSISPPGMGYSRRSDVVDVVAMFGLMVFCAAVVLLAGFLLAASAPREPARRPPDAYVVPYCKGKRLSHPCDLSGTIDT